MLNNLGIYTCMMILKVTSEKLVTELLDDWFGPSGDCWCVKEKKYVKPGTCLRQCPECQPLGNNIYRPFRYLQEDDYKTENDKTRYL